MSCSALIRMRGYQDSSPSNAHQATWPIKPSRQYFNEKIWQSLWLLLNLNKSTYQNRKGWRKIWVTNVILNKLTGSQKFGWLVSEKSNTAPFSSSSVSLITVCSRYIAVIFICITIKRHPIAHHSWVQIYPKFYNYNCCAVCIIITYVTAIYRETIVPGKLIN